MKNNKRNRKFKHLDLNDRIQIEIQYSQGKSYGEIAKHLGHGRNKSTVCREIGGRPNKGVGKYKAYTSHCRFLEKEKSRGRREKLKSEAIRTYVKEKMKIGWSPEQISIRISIDLGKEYRISYEAIYEYIYDQIGSNGKARSGSEDLRMYLPRRHKRRATKGARTAQKIERMASLPSIEDRPREADARKVVGHWEDDTMVSRQSDERIKSINERVSGVVLLGKMKNGSAIESSRVVCERLKEIPSPYLKTLTRDRGSENFGYGIIEKSLGMKVYFAHAYCSQERGSNENLNGLVRRFFPKKTDFAKVSSEEIKRVEYLLNNRPRKRFGGKTPLEVLLEKTGVALKG
jgi:transposase, IS30 family